MSDHRASRKTRMLANKIFEKNKLSWFPRRNQMALICE